MSELRTDTITASDGTSPVTLTKQSAAKAWVNLNGDTASIRNSNNLTSLTDNGSGRYQINFSNSMSDGDYSVSGACNEENNTSNMTDFVYRESLSTSVELMSHSAGNTSLLDCLEQSGTIHGDLA
jgi:hypothetical protein